MAVLLTRVSDLAKASKQCNFEDTLPLRTKIDQIVIMHVPSVGAFLLDHIAEVSSINFLQKTCAFKQARKEKTRFVLRGFYRFGISITFKMSWASSTVRGFCSSFVSVENPLKVLVGRPKSLKQLCQVLLSILKIASDVWRQPARSKLARGCRPTEPLYVWRKMEASALPHIFEREDSRNL